MTIHTNPPHAHDQQSVSPEMQSTHASAIRPLSAAELQFVSGGVVNNPLYEGCVMNNPLFQGNGEVITNPLFQG